MVEKCQLCLANEEKDTVLSVLWGCVTVLIFPFILAWQAYNLKNAPEDELVCYHPKCEHVQAGVMWASGVLWGIIAIVVSMSVV